MPDEVHNVIVRRPEIDIRIEAARLRVHHDLNGTVSEPSAPTAKVREIVSYVEMKSEQDPFREVVRTRAQRMKEVREMFRLDRRRDMLRLDFQIREPRYELRRVERRENRLPWKADRNVRLHFFFPPAFFRISRIPPPPSAPAICFPNSLTALTTPVRSSSIFVFVIFCVSIIS